MKKQLKYTVSILMNNDRYDSSGDTLEEAFGGFKLDYRDVKTKGEITVKYGEKVAQRLIQLPRLRRYFASKLFMTALIGNFYTLLR